MATSKDKLRANLEKARAVLAAKRKEQAANPVHVAHRVVNDPLARATTLRYIQSEIRALEARIKTLQTLQKAL